jgi:class 3 adenylate cyclase
MSDRLAELPSLDTRMDDVRAVLDAVESERAVLFATGDGGFLGTVFAATYPERTAGLVLFNSTPRFTRSPDTPWLRTRAEVEERNQAVIRVWGDLEGMANLLKDRGAMPSASHDELVHSARRARLSHSPGAVAAYLLANLDLDVRDVLPSIRVPTLVMYRTVPPFPLEQSARYLAEHIPTARLVELPGADFGPAAGDQEALFTELESFLSESAEQRAQETGPDRVLATILFTDLVDATTRASELGDRRWRELMEQHHRLIRTQLGYFRGREIDTAGDGFFATFDGPARAIRCACAIRDSVRELGLEIRAGLHTGECEQLMDDKVGGIAVHIGARVASAAQPGEVLVSRTVRDLVAGSGIELDDRGQHTLKGVAGEWQLYAVTTTAEPTSSHLSL